MTVGSETSRGISLQLGADIDLAKWLKLFSINFSLGAEITYTTTVQGTFPINVPLNSKQYSYPMFIHRYNRHTFTWKHFKKAGEHKLFDTLGHEKLHRDVEDQYAGVSVVWQQPQPMSTPYPVNTPGVIPTTPDPGP